MYVWYMNDNKLTLPLVTRRQLTICRIPWDDLTMTRHSGSLWRWSPAWRNGWRTNYPNDPSGKHLAKQRGTLLAPNWCSVICARNSVTKIYLGNRGLSSTGATAPLRPVADFAEARSMHSGNFTRSRVRSAGPKLPWLKLPYLIMLI